tara:strand:+ start:606 stop:887 length:282 start_codon:yes stop_codon:yes gene_type:complete
MSEEIKEKEAVKAISINLTDEEVKSIEGLIKSTQYPHDFIEGLLETKDLSQERKLVIMYHFSQGHMYSAISQFLGEALPRMMGMGPVEEGLKG